MADVERLVTVTLEEGLRAEGRADPHGVTMDEPREEGGTDRGTTPVKLLLLALGGCALITMRLVARRKGWDLARARVTVRLTPAQGAEPARIVQEILLEGNLDDEQRERLRSIAGKCPVHRLISGPVVTEERLLGAEA